MKKMICAVILSLVCAGSIYAATDIEEPDYEELDKLHTKIVRMKREMDRLMKDVMSTYQETSASGFGSEVRVDVIENDKEMIVKADLPGMEKDRIDVTLEKSRVLKLAGMREVMKSQAAPGMVKQERSLGKFERIIELPAEGMNEGIKASYKDGVLEIVIPKKEPSRDKAVKINVI
ncbi:MAG: Hsp20/alpha crystallin family protein [Candidatus Omnitrophota bacterium]